MIILNQFPPPSGVYRYAYDIQSAVKESSLFTFLYGSPQRDIPSYAPGHYIQGKFKSLKVLNKILPNLSHAQFINEINKTVDSQTILHYASPMVPLKIASLPKVVTFHDPPSVLLNTDMFFGNSSSPSIGHSLQKKFQARYYDHFKKFDNVLAVSEYVKFALIESGFAGNIKVIYPCISDSFKLLAEKRALKEKLGLPLDKICVLSVSTRLRKKNLSMVKKTMEILGEKFKLVRIGPSIMTDDISITNIDYEKVNMVYNASDVLLFPSLYEGFGYPLVEAFATGLPAVTSDIEIFRETSGNAALLADPNDAQTLASAVKEAVNNSETLIRKGLERSKRFSFHRFTKNINEYYQSVLS